MCHLCNWHLSLFSLTQQNGNNLELEFGLCSGGWGDVSQSLLLWVYNAHVFSKYVMKTEKASVWLDSTIGCHICCCPMTCFVQNGCVHQFTIWGFFSTLLKYQKVMFERRGGKVSAISKSIHFFPFACSASADAIKSLGVTVVWQVGHTCVVLC